MNHAFSNANSIDNRTDVDIFVRIDEVLGVPGRIYEVPAGRQFSFCVSPDVTRDYATIWTKGSK